MTLPTKEQVRNILQREEQLGRFRNTVYSVLEKEFDNDKLCQDWSVSFEKKETKISNLKLMEKVISDLFDGLDINDVYIYQVLEDSIKISLNLESLLEEEEEEEEEEE